MGVKEMETKKISSPDILKKLFAGEGTLIIILAVLFAALTATSDSFLTVNNLSNLVRQTSVVGVVAIGMSFVIITGGIDLSVGAVVGFSGILSTILMKNGMGMILAIIVSILCSMLIGLINGILIHNGKVPPFIATMGIMAIVRGMIMLVSGARMIAGLPKAFTDFAQINIIGLPSLFFVWLIVIVAAAFITKWTVFGRNVYAVGSNTEAARLSGINVKTVIYKTYILSAFTSAVAGILMTSRLGNGIPTAGQGYEMDAIAAAVLGGASLSGAEGTILGTVLGAIIMATLRNGGNLLGINPFILDISIGALIIIAVLIDQNAKGKK
jgi:ribose/xylose/arabinose/galactoside ABC-type transport system permease subunit